MAQFVEGEWKNFVFKMGTPETNPLILAHLREVFYRDEPLCKLVGYTEEIGDNIEKFSSYYLNKNEGLSFYVEEKGTGKIAGVRVTSVGKKDAVDPDLGITSPEVLRILGVLNQVGAGGDLCAKYGVDKYGYFLMTCVDPAFRGQGLATEIYKRSIALLKAKGFTVCASIFSSPFTRKAAINLKFEEVFTKRFLDCKDEDGNSLMPNAAEDQEASFMALQIA